MTVPEQTPYTEHVANGVSGTFTYEFKCLLKEDLLVLANGVTLDPNTYTVTGLGQEGGGDVTISPIPSMGMKIMVRLAVLTRRTTSYQRGVPWPSSVVNDDLDRIWLALQGRTLDQAGAIRLPAPESPPPLPGPTERARKLIAFDEYGNPWVMVPAVDSSLELANELAQPSGSGIIGFSMGAPGAVATNLLDKLRSILVEPEDFGAIGNGIADDTAALQKGLDYIGSIGGGILRGRPGRTYRFTAALTVPDHCTLAGCGYTSDDPTSFTQATVYLKDGDFRGITLGNCSGMVDCTVNGAAGNGDDGIYMIGTRSWMQNVSVFAQGRDNIRIGGDNSTDNTNMWRAINIISRGAGRHGVFINHESADPNHTDVNNGLLLGLDTRRSASGSGLHLGKASDNTLIQVSAQFNDKGIVFDDSSKGNVLVTYYVEGNTTNEVLLSTGSRRNSVLTTTNAATSSDLVVNQGTGNYVMGRDTKTGESIVRTPLALIHAYLTATGVAGYLDVGADSDGGYSLTLRGTSASRELRMLSAGAGRMALKLNDGATVSALYRRTMTLNFGSLSAAQSVDQNISLTGATTGMNVIVTPRFAIPAGIVWNAFILTDGLVTIRCTNVSGGSITIGSGVWGAEAIAP
ncbi:hypothetical protein [Pigmentiphaga sp. CHJ604]|uniref:hypothetical protein n=1 Tax=Pigmentiphaga sp. CHJ604 TaxID=3081984 RepID=UPI0030D39567